MCGIQMCVIRIRDWLQYSASCIHQMEEVSQTLTSSPYIGTKGQMSDKDHCAGYCGLTFCLSSPPAEAFRETNISTWANLRAKWHQTPSTPFYCPTLEPLTSPLHAARPVYSSLTPPEDSTNRPNSNSALPKAQAVEYWDICVYY